MLQRKLPPVRPVSIDLSAIWYVARTNPRCEEKAFAGLLAAGFRAHLPRGLKHIRRRHMKAKQPVTFSLLPGYLFVGLSRDTPAFYDLRRVDGVAALLGRQTDSDPRAVRSRYVEVPSAIVAEFHRLEAAGVFSECDVEGRPFEPGDTVTIKEGALRGLTFAFDDYFGRNAAKVIGNLFGSTKPMTIDLANLARAA